jgi:hypothetical protein
MMYITETDLIMFQCYPSVLNLDDLTKYVTNYPHLRIIKLLNFLLFY